MISSIFRELTSPREKLQDIWIGSFISAIACTILSISSQAWFLALPFPVGCAVVATAVFAFSAIVLAILYPQDNLSSISWASLIDPRLLGSATSISTEEHESEYKINVLCNRIQTGEIALPLRIHTTESIKIEAARYFLATFINSDDCPEQLKKGLILTVDFDNYVPESEYSFRKYNRFERFLNGEVLKAKKMQRPLILIAANAERVGDPLEPWDKALPQLMSQHGHLHFIALTKKGPYSWRSLPNGWSELNTILPLPKEKLEAILEKIASEGEVAFDREAISSIATLENNLTAATKKLTEISAQAVRDSRDRVDASYARQVLCGAPLASPERTPLLHHYLSEHIIGQEAAVNTLCEAMTVASMGMNNWRRNRKQPVGQLMFLGSSGVGKTALAKLIANFYDANFICINMGQFKEEHSIGSLVGAPNGYIGAGEGQLTSALQEHPKSVVLLDEVEKANRSVLDAFLAVFDSGEIVTGDGKTTVDCSQALFILTSNAGAEAIHAAQKLGTSIDDPAIAESIKSLLHIRFRSEFIGRLSGIVTFNPMNDLMRRAISELRLSEYAEALKERQGVKLTWDDSVVQLLMTKGADPKLGARPIENFLNIELSSKVCKALLNNPGQKHLHLSFENDGVTVSLPKGD